MEPRRAPVTPRPRPATGAGDPSRPGFSAGNFEGASGTRNYKLFEPDGYEGQSLPLIVMLHGCTQSADDFAAGTRMNALAQQRGLVVLYPEQAPRSNVNKCWNWFVPADQRRGQGEPALLAAMTQQVMSTHDIDADRVYVAGLSAGGAMAAILAREYPDLFAAAGVHSGLPAGAAHDVASAFAAMHASAPSAAIWPGASASARSSRTPAWPSVAAATSEVPSGAEDDRGAPLIVFHGDADSTVHASNGARVVEAALGSSSWTMTRDGLPTSASHGKGHTRVVYRRPEDGPDAPSRAEHWVVHGAAHAWSGGDASGSYTDPTGPDASREMLRFFAEHPLRHAAERAIA